MVKKIQNSKLNIHITSKDFTSEFDRAGSFLTFFLVFFFFFLLFFSRDCTIGSGMIRKVAIDSWLHLGVCILSHVTKKKKVSLNFLFSYYPPSCIFVCPGGSETERVSFALFFSARPLFFSFRFKQMRFSIFSRTNTFVILHYFFPFSFSCITTLFLRNDVIKNCMNANIDEAFRIFFIRVILSKRQNFKFITICIFGI